MKIISLKEFLSKRPSSKKATSLIYDGEDAYWGEATETDMLVCTRGKVSAYWRGEESETSELLKPRPINHKFSSPLLTSHLQKAVRVGNTTAALETTMSLLYSDPLKLLRRLPIIMVEDANVVPGTSVIMWLVLTNGTRPIYENDAALVLGYVQSLCETRTAMDVRGIGRHPLISRDLILRLGTPYAGDLASLLLRREYGGMKGDMWRLSNAVYSFSLSGRGRSMPLRLNPYDVGFLDGNGPNFLMAGIDYHPFPRLLNEVADGEPSLTKAEVKKYVWIVESGPNFRKPSSLKRMHCHSLHPVWELIQPHLHRFRETVLLRELKRAEFPRPRSRKSAG